MKATLLSRTTITVDKRILEKAREENINISVAAEKGIIEAIKNKEHVLGTKNNKPLNKKQDNYSKNRNSLEETDEASDGLVRGEGFEPSDLCRTAPSTLRLWPDSATPARFFG